MPATSQGLQRKKNFKPTVTINQGNSKNRELQRT